MRGYFTMRQDLPVAYRLMMIRLLILIFSLEIFNCKMAYLMILCSKTVRGSAFYICFVFIVFIYNLMNPIILIIVEIFYILAWYNNKLIKHQRLTWQLNSEWINCSRTRCCYKNEHLPRATETTEAIEYKLIRTFHVMF